MKTRAELLTEDIKERCEELIKLVGDSEQNGVSVPVNDYVQLQVTSKEVRIAYEYGKDFVYIDKEIDWGVYGYVTAQTRLISGRRKIERKLKQKQKAMNKAIKNRIAPRKARLARRAKGLIAVMIAATAIGTASAARFFGIKVAYDNNQISITRTIDSSEIIQ